MAIQYFLSNGEVIGHDKHGEYKLLQHQEVDAQQSLDMQIQMVELYLYLSVRAVSEAVQYLLSGKRRVRLYSRRGCRYCFYALYTSCIRAPGRSCSRTAGRFWQAKGR